MGLHVQVDVHAGNGHVVVTATGQADTNAAGSLAAVLDVLAAEPVRTLVLDLEHTDAEPTALDALATAIADRGVAERVSLTVRGRHKVTARTHRRIPGLARHPHGRVQPAS